MTSPEPAVDPLLDRTRSAILNILIVAGIGIATSGLALGRRDRGALLWPPRDAERGAHAALLGLIVAGLVVRRTVASRSALRDPARRRSRFFWGHVAAAVVGALAVPLGFAYGWAIRPRLDAVAPFWVAALALGLLALPRAAELEGLDAPPTDPRESRP